MMSGNADFGLIGLAVMGENLASTLKVVDTLSRFITEPRIK